MAGAEIIYGGRPGAKTVASGRRSPNFSNISQIRSFYINQHYTNSDNTYSYKPAVAKH